MPISSGIALGTTRVVLPGHLAVAEKPIPASKVKAEITALEQAINDTAQELTDLRRSAGKKMGGSVAKVFDAQLLIATDQEFLGRVREEITTRRRNAGFIYNLLVKQTTHQLSQSSNQYLRQSAQEIEAVADRVLSHLSGFGEKSTARLATDTVLVTRSFNPGDILSYRQRRAVGFLAGEGGTHSHMALIARSLMVPMVVAPDVLAKVPTEVRVILDGTNGLVILSPTDKEWADYRTRQRQQGPAIVSRIKKLSQIPPKTADGHPMPIAANLEFPGPVDDLLAAKSIPVGLYRTEFLYLENPDSPDEKAQFRLYDRIAEKFAKSHVVFRTFDLGSDKVKAGGPAVAETNPALGWRGIRSMLEMPRVFKTQIRAILRASTRRNLSILLPMITDLSELKKAKRLIGQAMLELRREGESFDERIPVGIMVEVPSAALTAGPLAQAADFVSIGTNDLTQYTLSADRGNRLVAGLYNPYHPSVLNLIGMTVEACRKYGKDVSICGEMAGDPLAIPLFVGMGVTSLSMNPNKVFDSCRLMKKIDLQLVKHLVEPVLASPSATSVTRKLQNYRNAIENK
jgi:phosphotransferase system enzyme I (PtsI)